MCISCGRRVGVQSSRFEIKLAAFKLQYNSVCAVHRYCDGDKGEPHQHIEDYIFDVNYEKYYDQLINVKSFDRNGLNIMLCDPGNFDLSGYSLDRLFFEPPIDLKGFQFIDGRILLASSPIRTMIRKRIRRGAWSNKKSKKIIDENSKIVENVTATIISSQNINMSETSKVVNNVTATVVSGQNVDISEIPKVVTNVAETIVNDQNSDTHMSDLQVVENESVTIVPDQNIETEIITDLIEILSDDSLNDVSTDNLVKQNVLIHTNTLPNYFEVQKTTNFGIRDILSHKNSVTNDHSTVSVSTQNACVNELENLNFPPQFGLFSNENEQSFNAIVSSNPTFNQVFSHSTDQNISHSNISNINDQHNNVFVIPNGNVPTTSSFNESILFFPNNFNSQQNFAENAFQRNNSNQIPTLQPTPFFCSFPNYPDSLEPSMISNVLPPITSINFSNKNMNCVDYPNMLPQNFQ